MLLSNIHCLFTEVDLFGNITQKEPIPELDVFFMFYEKICSMLPIDEILPKLVAENVITVSQKVKISDNGKTESERSQYLLDHYIGRPLSVGDSSFFNKLLDIMSTSSKCNYLTDEIKCKLSTTMKYQKFSGKRIQYRAIATIYN